MYLNIQSLRYKVDELLVLLDSCDYPSAVLICEHWLRVNESVFIDNYQVVSSFCRSVFKNGGTLVLVKDSFLSENIFVSVNRFNYLLEEKVFEFSLVYCSRLNFYYFVFVQSTLW